jgi:hypothetical protein
LLELAVGGGEFLLARVELRETAMRFRLRQHRFRPCQYVLQHLFGSIEFARSDGDPCRHRERAQFSLGVLRHSVFPNRLLAIPLRVRKAAHTHRVLRKERKDDRSVTVFRGRSKRVRRLVLLLRAGEIVLPEADIP